MLLPVKHIEHEKGDTVHWQWGASEAEGKIEKKHTETITKTIKGTKVKRKATANEPAYEIKQADGGNVLKSESEIKKGGK